MGKALGSHNALSGGRWEATGSVVPTPWLPGHTDLPPSIHPTFHSKGPAGSDCHHGPSKEHCYKYLSQLWPAVWSRQCRHSPV